MSRKAQSRGPLTATNADRGAGVANSLAKLLHFSYQVTVVFEHVILAQESS
jgi:hypothetical protein